MGQTKAVTIYRLVTSGTVDADINRMQLKKIELGENVLQDGKSDGAAGKVNTTMEQMLSSILQNHIESDSAGAVKSPPRPEAKNIISPLS
jgi:SNF2 family DNA or RNA helicase